MKNILKFLFFFTFIILNQQILKADTYYLDFKFIIDQSVAGKKTNQALKNELDQGVKKLKTKEQELQKKEKEIIQQKKLISPEEYKKKISSLREEVTSLQKERNKVIQSISTKRNNARKKLLDELNPIVKNYMIEKDIKLILDKKSVLLGDEKLDITKDIIEILNKNLKTIKLN